MSSKAVKLLLALGLASTVVACGPGDTGTETTDPAADPAAPAETVDPAADPAAPAPEATGAPAEGGEGGEGGEG